MRRQCFSAMLNDLTLLSLLMYKSRAYKERFDVLDLDPYGSASPFLDGAVQSVQDGGEQYVCTCGMVTAYAGLLCVTCTDAAVLCGNHSDACYGKYGSIPVKAKFCHDMVGTINLSMTDCRAKGIRVLLFSIATHAARYGRYIKPVRSTKPWFSCS